MIINLSGILAIVKLSIKKAVHLLAEECEEIIDHKTVPVKKHNKAMSIKDSTLLVSCKPFVASSILFFLVIVITVGVFIYFYVDSRPKRKLKGYY